MNRFSRLKEIVLTGKVIHSPRDLEEADEDGWTIAHVSAMYGRLPDNFDQWDLADNEGWTVAHTAAASGKLPPHCQKDPKILALTKQGGLTVEKVIHDQINEKIENCRKMLASARQIA